LKKKCACSLSYVEFRPKKKKAQQEYKKAGLFGIGNQWEHEAERRRRSIPYICMKVR
jgi:hypothetical protein